MLPGKRTCQLAAASICCRCCCCCRYDLPLLPPWYATSSSKAKAYSATGEAAATFPARSAATALLRHGDRMPLDRRRCVQPQRWSHRVAWYSAVKRDQVCVLQGAGSMRAQLSGSGRGHAGDARRHHVGVGRRPAAPAASEDAAQTRAAT